MVNQSMAYWAEPAQADARRSANEFHKCRVMGVEVDQFPIMHRTERRVDEQAFVDDAGPGAGTCPQAQACVGSGFVNAAPKPRQGESYPPRPVSGRAEVGVTQYPSEEKVLAGQLQSFPGPASSRLLISFFNEVAGWFCKGTRAISTPFSNRRLIAA